MQQISEASQSISPPEKNGVVREPLSLVLDTNVVLDLLVFGDPACEALARMLDSGSRRWLATPPMRLEFDDVLRRPAFQCWQAQQENVHALWARWAVMVPADQGVAPRRELRCADPDDQMFLDLALRLAPSELLSRDRELLRLARPAAAMGVLIAPPRGLIGNA